MKNFTSLAVSFALVLLSLPAPVAGQNTTPTTAAPASQSQPPATPAQGQQQTPAPAPTPADDNEDDVVRITTNLVQVDVVVLDKSGQQVTDLKPEDFELIEDGERREITNFSYVSNEMGTRSVEKVETARPDRNVPLPPARLKPEQVRRTIGLVVDDLGTSFESTASVRQALKKFVDEQMQPNDLVAIIRTSTGMGALQQFTSDKRQLYAAIERVRWYPAGRAGISAFGPLEGDPLAQTRNQIPGGGQRNDEPTRDTTGLDEINRFREDIFSVGTLGALNFIVRGMRQLPGRKSIVFFSDGFEIYPQDKNGQSNRVIEALRRLTDLANRASVVIYAVDARGLIYTGLTAADQTAGMNPLQIEAALTERSRKYFDTQTGMNYLAQQTGGFFIRNNNDLSRGVARVLDDQKGYYLIGYRPDPGTFDPAKGRAKFHHIEARVKRPGLKVRTRSGFYGFTEEETRPGQANTRVQQIVAALTSPFAAGGVQLRLTSLFNSEDLKTAFMTSLLHMNARDFTFTDEPDGWHKTVIDVVALTFGDNGSVVDEVNRTETIRLRGETYELALRTGIVYSMHVPIKKSGAYQLRVAVRDAGSQKVGSASQFIEVPNLGKGRLAMSGLIVMGSEHTDARLSEEQGNAKEPDPLTSPAIRRFKRGAKVDYFYDIFNAKLGPAGQPQLTTQVRLFRDGQPVFTGNPVPFNVEGQSNMKRLRAAARLQLGSDMTPGEYVLQVIATDTLASEKRRTTAQWIDFEIIK